jgi:hypothetical protein
MKTWKTLFPTSFHDYVWNFPMFYSCLSIPFTGSDYFMWWCIANLFCSSIGITLYLPMLEPWMQNVFHCPQFTMHIVITCGVNCQCFNGKSSWLNHDSHIVQACCPKGVLLCGTLGEVTTIFFEWHAEEPGATYWEFIIYLNIKKVLRIGL